MSLRAGLRKGTKSSADGVAAFLRDSLGKTGRRLTSDPIRTSLGLLPSGPDPVGEWLVHRQSPGPYLGPKERESKRSVGCSGAVGSDPGRPRRWQVISTRRAVLRPAERHAPPAPEHASRLLSAGVVSATVR